MVTIREKRPSEFEIREFVGREAGRRPKQVGRTVRGTLNDAHLFALQLTVRPSSPEGATTSLGVLLDLWVDASAPYWAPANLQNQRSRARLVRVDPIASVVLSRLTTIEIDRWRLRMSEQGLGDGSMRNRHLVVRAAISLAVRCGAVGLAPGEPRSLSATRPTTALPEGSHRR